MAACPDGTFADGTNTCILCDATCRTCSDVTANGCLSCGITIVKYLYFVTMSCVNPCPGGYTNSGVNCVGTLCHADCANCLINANPS